MSRPIWNPSQYLKFTAQRTRPAVDLLNRVDADAPAVVYDLGCGPGNVTPFLRGRWPEARIVGVDSSEEMLEKARADFPADDDPLIEWRRGDAGAWAPESPAEVIFSNAALHWIDDHAALFPRLVGLLAPGGTLAVQMPHNHKAPSHISIRAAAEAGPWADRLVPLLREAPVHDPGVYYDILSPVASRLDIWETEYAQIMEGDDPVADWTRGSAVKPLLDALTDDGERAEFFAAYSDLVRGAYPKRADGRTLFPFRRLFIVATR